MPRRFGIGAFLHRLRARAVPPTLRPLLRGAAAAPPEHIAAIAARIANAPALRTRAGRLAARRRITTATVVRLAEALRAAGAAQGAAELVEAGLVPAPADARLQRLRLALLAGTGAHAAFLAYGRLLLARGQSDAATLFELWTHARRLAIDPTLADAAAEALTQCQDGSAEALLWLGRLERERGHDAAALRAFRDAADAARTADERRRALRNAALLGGRSDDLEAVADLISAAVAEGATDDPHVHAVAAMLARRAHPPGDATLAAFEHLFEHALPDRHYRPASDVLMVAPSLGCGGMERVLAATVSGLAARGRRGVTLALSRFDPAGPSGFFLGQSGLAPGEVRRLAADGPPDPVIATLPQPLISEAQGAFALIGALRPRIVHIWNDRLGLAAGFAALLAGTPRIVVHFHHMRPTRDPAERESARRYPPIYRLALDRPEFRFLFCAEAAARDYAEFWDVPRSPQMIALRNGFAPVPPIGAAERAEARARFGIPADAPVVGSLFRFEPVKQPLQWVAAAAAIARQLPAARFLMAGDGELLAETRAAADAQGLRERLVTPGRLADVRPALAAIDLAMMSSASEGLPNGAVEAQLAGVPLVAFDVGGLAETCLPGVSGRLVAPGSTAELAAAAAGWLLDRTGRAEAGCAAARFAAEAFAMERYLDELTRIYGSDE